MPFLGGEALLVKRSSINQAVIDVAKGPSVKSNALDQVTTYPQGLHLQAHRHMHEVIDEHYRRYNYHRMSGTESEGLIRRTPVRRAGETNGPACLIRYPGPEGISLSTGNAYTVQ